MARPKKSHKFDEDVESYITNHICINEYEPAKSSSNVNSLDFESLLDMLECKRAEKDYSWLSDFCFPHIPQIILTDASSWANQYFQTRDFVDAKLDGTGKDDLKKCDAAKSVINKTLNRRDLFHYHKYIRGRLINALAGQVWGLCWWSQDIRPYVRGWEEQPSTLDEQGNEISQSPKPQYGERILRDQFEYEIYDSRNVFTDNRYVYSVQDKDFIIFRSEKTYEELKAEEVKKGYFNLHLIKDLKPPEKTDTEKESYGKNEPNPQYGKKVSGTFDVLLRFGKMWAIVKEKDPSGYPIKITPGYTVTGEPSDKAELVEAVIEQIVTSGIKILIRFEPLIYRDSKGRPYRPVIRGWCYIHPTKDIGLSDGKYNREIQIGINDSLNMAGDRIKLSTVPTLKANRLSIEDNDTIYFAPEHIMELNDVKDIEEFKIDGNVEGPLAMAQLFKSEGQTVSSVYPTSMGDTGAIKASMPATIGAIAENRSNLRGNYKSLTFEYTFLLDFYWIILQMTDQFAQDETLQKMIGDNVQYFDPNPDYTYSPVTSNIEMEYNKKTKIQNYDQTMGRISGMVQVIPELVPIIAHIIRRQLELQGDEFPAIAQMIENLSKAQPRQEGAQGNQIANVNPMESTNQSGIAPSSAETATRLIGNTMAGTQARIS